MDDHHPIFGIAGFGGSGKTTLLARVLPALRERGLRTAVIKHAAHGFAPGKADTDDARLRKLAPDVLVQSPAGALLNGQPTEQTDFSQAAAMLARRNDLVLVEGYKCAPIEKAWLADADNPQPPADVANVKLVLPPGDARAEALLTLLDGWLAEKSRQTPLAGCVLIGGQSRRMGRPKHRIETNGQTWLARTADVLRRVCGEVVIVGVGEDAVGLPRLSDAPDASGPMAGLLAALRHRPTSAWLAAACDLPGLSTDALQWLIAQRRVGAWAVLPRRDGGDRVEPLPAVYDFRAAVLLEERSRLGSFRLNDLAGHAKVLAPTIPAELAPAWRNVNTPEQLGGAS